MKLTINSMNPYNAFDNNPVFWADPSGADAESTDTSTETGGYDVKLTFGVMASDLQKVGAVDSYYYGDSYETNNSSKKNNSPAQNNNSSNQSSNFNDVVFEGEDPDAFILPTAEIIKGNNSFNDNSMMASIGYAERIIKWWNSFTGNTSILFSTLGLGAELSQKTLQNSTLRFFNQRGTNFSMKLYTSGWKGGSRGQIKTYGTSGLAKGLKIGGYGLGLFNAASIQYQYNTGQISGFQATLEQGSNTYSTFGGIYGAAWGVGWEAGRAITTIPAYQQWKQETWLPFRQDVFGY